MAKVQQNNLLLISFQNGFDYSIFLQMNNSSKSIRLLTAQSTNKRQQPLIVRIKGRNFHARKSNLALHSAINMNKIFNLNKQLSKSNQLHQQEIDSFIEESKLCQVQLFQKISQSQFSQVYKVRIKTTGKHYALKKIIVDEQHQKRQQQIFHKLKSSFIVKTVGIYKQKIKEKKQINILMQLYDWNLKDYIKSKQKVECLVNKAILYQMVRSILYLHSKKIIHKNICPQNFIMKKNGRVALCNFVKAEYFQPSQEYFYLNSRSYRAPQLLLDCPNYSKAIDIWALACVMIEFTTKKEIFKGSSTLDCLLNISRIIGSKDMKRLKGNQQLIKTIPIIKGITLSQYLREAKCPLFVDLLSNMLRIKSQERLTAVQILAHPFFDEIRDQQSYKEIMNHKIDISDFFTFSINQLRYCEEYKAKIIPLWKRDHYDKR